MANDNNTNNSQLDTSNNILKSPLLPLQTPPDQHDNNTTSFSLRSLIFTTKTLFVILGPILCTLICLFVDAGGRSSSRNMLAVLVWVFEWWFTEAVPMAITSMAPLFLFPLFGIASSDDVAKSYMNDIISLVLGSFILAIAVEHYNLHRRLAFKMTSLFYGERFNPPIMLLGICATSMFVSMWMHNTAAAMMMIPVATGILERFPSGEDAHPDVKKFCKAVILGVTFSVAIGGMSTLTGTGVNLILVGMWESYFPAEKSIGFSTWFMFGFPLAVVIFFAQWALLCLFYCSKTSAKALSPYLDKSDLKKEIQSLGPMSFAEKMVLLDFSLLVVLWMTRSLTNSVPGWGVLFNGRVGDGAASIRVACLRCKMNIIGAANWKSWRRRCDDSDAVVHNPKQEQTWRKTHGLEQMQETPLEHRPPPRRRIRHRRRRPHIRTRRQPLVQPRFPPNGPLPRHRPSLLPHQRRHHRVHIQRRHHHARRPFAHRARPGHEGSSSPAHGPRRHRSSARFLDSDEHAVQRRWVHHWPYSDHRYDQGWSSAQARRHRRHHRPHAHSRSLGFQHKQQKRALIHQNLRLIVMLIPVFCGVDALFVLCIQCYILYKIP